MAVARNAGWLLGTPPVQAFLKWMIGRTVTGPDERELETGSSCIWCEARNAAGQTVTVELTTPNGYTLTADSAVTAIERLLGGDYAGPAAGFLTPSRACGHTFVGGLKGVEWVSAL